MVNYKRGLRNDSERDILAAAFEVENEQTFHLKEFYKYLHDYLCYDENFKSFWDDDKPEIFYFERQHPDGRREHHIWWRFYKIPLKNRYFRWLLKMDIQTLNMGKQEVIKNGQKFKLDKGDIILRMQAFVQLDWKNEWRNHWFLKNWDHYFRKRIYKAKIDYQKQELYKKIYKIQNKVKQFLELSVPSEMAPSFQPAKGMR